MNYVYFVFVENKNQEERDDFDRTIGLVFDPSLDVADEFIPAELRGVQTPSWWGKQEAANPQNVRHKLGV